MYRSVYPWVMLVSIATGSLLYRRSRSALGLTARERLAIGLGAFCGAMIGAKLPFVLADWRGLLSGRVWFENGKTIVFGIVGGYFGVETAKAIFAIRVKTGDSFAVPVAVAVAIGRLACFCGGCCYGVAAELPWSCDFGDGIRRHPTQLYECIFHLVAAASIARLQSRGAFRGQLIKLYILSYLIYRFFTEFIRPEPVMAFGLTAYQWGCLALVPAFVYLWARDAAKFAAENQNINDRFVMTREA